MTIPAFFAGDLVLFVTPSGRRSFFLDGKLSLEFGLGGNAYMGRCACGDCYQVAAIDMTQACARVTPEYHCQVWRLGQRIWPPFDVHADLPPIGKESQ